MFSLVAIDRTPELVGLIRLDLDKDGTGIAALLI